MCGLSSAQLYAGDHIIQNTTDRPWGVEMVGGDRRSISIGIIEPGKSKDFKGDIVGITVFDHKKSYFQVYGGRAYAKYIEARKFECHSHDPIIRHNWKFQIVNDPAGGDPAVTVRKWAGWTPDAGCK